MATVVCADAHTGKVSRYEIGGTKVRLTHRGDIDDRYPRPVTYTREFIENFRVEPPEHLRVGDPNPFLTMPGVA